ncbi:hypothetical protein [Psychrobacter jeotgali]|uniref:hypothetical protein n=1 Tax=Psychrobacter jeotgali TaxID=179010 RepID=UPI00191AFAC1|nr:hypothetical protein [Psychrobacter jeotgali]
MTVQAQVDVKILNDCLSGESKKTTDLFKLNRLEKAVSALEKVEPVQGYAARTLYLCYMNKPKEAVSYITNIIEQYGSIDSLQEIRLYALKKYGNWDLYKSETERYLLSKKPETAAEVLDTYISESQMFSDNSGSFVEVLKHHNVADFHKLNHIIDEQKQNYLDLGVKLKTFRKVLQIAFSVIDSLFNVQLYTDVRTSNVMQIIISNEFWTSEQASELTEEINNAILAEDDIEFQLAADEIEVFCINVNPEKVPLDFKLYEDDSDEELVSLIKSRMASEPKFERLDV